MQIMPTLMHYLAETCTWLMDDDSCPSDAINNAMQALSGWQWLTVAVFSCPMHCLLNEVTRQPGNVCTVQEELVIVATEQ